jgi:hypothetical protein
MRVERAKAAPTIVSDANFLMKFVREMSCSECGRGTMEELFVDGEEKSFLFFKWSTAITRPLCRTHLLRQWREAFVRAQAKMVVLDPIGNLDTFAARDLRLQYWYASIDQLASPNPGSSKRPAKQRKEQYRQWSESIAGRCSRCKNSEATAAFAPADFETENKALDWVSIDCDKLNPNFENLCRTCAWAQIEKSVSGSPIRFTQGIHVPRNFPGIYITIAQ